MRGVRHGVGASVAEEDPATLSVDVEELLDEGLDLGFVGEGDLHDDRSVSRRKYHQLQIEDPAAQRKAVKERAREITDGIRAGYQPDWIEPSLATPLKSPFFATTIPFESMTTISSP